MFVGVSCTVNGNIKAASTSTTYSVARFTSANAFIDNVHTVNAANPEVTMLAYAKVNAAQSDGTKEVLFGIADDTSANEQLRCIIEHNADNTFYFKIGYANTSFIETDGTTNYDVGTWYRIALVQGADDDRRLYVDKVLEVTDSTSRAIPTMDSFAIGGAPDSTPSKVTNTSISDGQLLSAAATAADITYDYDNPTQLMYNRAGTSLVSGDQVLYWPCDDASGTTLDDNTANANDGTADGTIVWDETTTRPLRT